MGNEALCSQEKVREGIRAMSDAAEAAGLNLLETATAARSVLAACTGILAQRLDGVRDGGGSDAG